MTRTIALVIVCALAGCGAKMKMASAPMAAAAPSMAAPAAPPPLDRSVFARDPNGQLCEDALQKILGVADRARSAVARRRAADHHRDRLARAEPRLPARAAGHGPARRAAAQGRGVLAGHRDDADSVGRARHGGAARSVGALPAALRGAVSRGAREEVAPRTRGRSDVRDGVGAVFVPGREHEVYGYIEATMFDVKTGLLMFTTRRAVMGSEQRTSGTPMTSSSSSRRTRPASSRRSSRPTCSSTCAGSRMRRSPRTTSCTCRARRSSIRPKLRRSRPTRTDDVGATSTSIGSWVGRFTPRC